MSHMLSRYAGKLLGCAHSARHLPHRHECFCRPGTMFPVKLLWQPFLPQAYPKSQDASSHRYFSTHRNGKDITVEPAWMRLYHESRRFLLLMFQAASEGWVQPTLPSGHGLHLSETCFLVTASLECAFLLPKLFRPLKKHFSKYYFYLKCMHELSARISVYHVHA